MRGTAWRYRSLFLGVLGLGVLFLSACGQQASAAAPTTGEVYTMTVACPSSQSNCDVNKQISTTEQVLLRRVQQGLGYTFASVKQTGGTGLQITIPGALDSQDLRSVLVVPGVVDFLNTGGDQLKVGSTVTPGKYPVVETGASLDPRSISATLDPSEKVPVINFEFQGQARQQFANFTKNNLTRYLTVTVDDTVVASVQISTEVVGPARINGEPTLEQAKVVAAKMEGMLPLAVNITSERHYSNNTSTSAK